MNKTVVYIASSDQNLDYALWGNIVLRSFKKHLTHDVDFRWYCYNKETVPCVIDEFPVEIVELPLHNYEGLDGEQQYNIEAFSLCPDSTAHVVAEGKYDRAIYVDIDMPAVTNVDVLIEQDISDKAVYSIIDFAYNPDDPDTLLHNSHYQTNLEYVDKGKCSYYFRDQMKEHQVQFNAGLFIVNCERYRNLHIPDFRRWCDVFYRRYLDQEFLNVQLQGEIGEIPGSFNSRGWETKYINTEQDFIDSLHVLYKEERHVVQYLYEHKYFAENWLEIKKDIEAGKEIWEIGGGILTVDFGTLFEYMKEDSRLFGALCNHEQYVILSDLIKKRDEKYGSL